MMRFVCSLTAVAGIACLAGTADAVVHWSDNFDDAGLADGDRLTSTLGHNGWKGWDDDDAFAGEIDLDQFRSAPFSMLLTDYGTSTTDAINDVSGLGLSNTGEYVIVCYYYIPTGTTGDNYFIFLSDYVDGNGQDNSWAVQLRIDGDLGIIESEYDAVSIDLAANSLYDQWIRFAVWIDLDNDWTQFFVDKFVLDTRAWSDGPNGGEGNPLVLAAFDMFNNGGTPVWVDDMYIGDEPAAAGPCLADLDDTGVVDIGDVFELLGQWGACPTPCTPGVPSGTCPADLDFSCVVDIGDVFELLGQWGPCPAAVGACCYPDQTCLELTRSECEATGGSWYGTFNTCATFVCPLNDSCGTAAPVGDIVTGVPTTVCKVGDTSLSQAGVQDLDDCVGGTVSSNVLWYTVEGTGELLSATLCGFGPLGEYTFENSYLNVYCGICDYLTCVDIIGDRAGACGAGPTGTEWGAGLVSWCSEVGRTYYIAVGGLSATDSGQFILCVTNDQYDGSGNPIPDGTVDACGASTVFGTAPATPTKCWCEITCVAGVAEGETCYTDGTQVEDTYNSGYNSCTGTALLGAQLTASGSAVCGTAGDYRTEPRTDDCTGFEADPALLRDTDWYRLTVPDSGSGGSTLTIDVNAEFICSILVIDDQCADPNDPVGTFDRLLIPYGFTTAERCVAEQFVVPYLAAGGNWILFVSNVDTVDCYPDFQSDIWSEYEVGITYSAPAGGAPPDGCHSYATGTTARTSDIGSGASSATGEAFHVADDIYLDPGHGNATINQVTFWGIEAAFDDNDGFIPCTGLGLAPFQTEYDITFYSDTTLDGCPDTVLATESVTVVASDTGDDFGGQFNINKYVATLTTPVVLSDDTCYWMEVYGTHVGAANSACWFLFHDSLDGNAAGLQDGWPAADPPPGYACPDDDTGADSAWCLNETIGTAPVLGSICNCLPGIAP